MHHSGSGTYEFEIIPKNKFDEQWILEMATAMQYVNDSLNFIGNLVQNYGIFRWNMASMYSSINDYRKILVPIEKNDRVSAIIQGEKINGVYYFNVFTRDSILTLLDSGNLTNRQKATLAPLVATIINVDFLYFGRTNETLRNWISDIDQSNITNDTDVISRCEFTVTTHTKVWYQYGQGNTLEEFEIVAGFFILTLVECVDDLGAGYVGPVGPGSQIGNPGHGVVPPLPGLGNPPASTNERLNDDLMDLFDREEEECLKRNLSTDAMEELQKLFRSTAFSGCDEVSVNEIIYRIVEEICSNSNQNNYNPEDPLGSLVASVPFTNSENIVEQINDSGANIMEFSSDCKFLRCVIKAMSQVLNDPMSTNIYCELSQGFSTSNVGLMIFYRDFSEDPRMEDHNHGATRFQNLNNGYRSAIYFNTNKCDNHNVLSAADYVLHELMHAHIYRILFDEYNWSGGDNDLNDKLDELSGTLLNTVFTEDRQHNLMVHYFLDDIAESLWRFNGEIGNKDVYRGLILYGFPANIVSNAGYNQQQMYNDWVSFLNENPFHFMTTNFVNNCMQN